MPAVVVQRFASRATAVAGVGTQDVANTLTITRTTYVEFAPDIFSRATLLAAGTTPSFVVFRFGVGKLVLDPVADLTTVNMNTYLAVPAANMTELGWANANFALTSGLDAITVTFS